MKYTINELFEMYVMSDGVENTLDFINFLRECEAQVQEVVADQLGSVYDQAPEEFQEATL